MSAKALMFCNLSRYLSSFFGVPCFGSPYETIFSAITNHAKLCALRSRQINRKASVAVSDGTAAGVVALSIMFLGLVQIGYGQQSETGLPVYGSFHGGTFDNVQLQNGNLHVEIPIVSVPQRAGPNFGYKFVYDIRSWENDKSTPDGGKTFQWTVAVPAHDFADWHLLTDPNYGASYWYDTVPKSCSWRDLNGWDHTNYYSVKTNYVVVDFHGTRHPFELRYVAQPTIGCTDATGNQQTGVALDGSGIMLDIGPYGSSPTWQWPDDYGPVNGNGVLPSSILTDTVQNDSHGAKISETWTVQDSNGNPQQFTVNYAQVSLQTHFCTVQTTPCTEVTGSSNLAQKLTLPEGRFYQFTYSTDGNADLIRIDLPTGGYIAYTYSSLIKVGPLPTDGRRGIWQYLARRYVTSRTVSDGTTPQTWNINGGTVTDPLGNDEVHVFGAALDSVTGLPDGGLYETQVRSYKGSAASGTLLRTINNAYIGEIATPQPDAIDHGTINARKIRETTILEDGTQSKVETDFETFQQQFVSPTYLYRVTRLNPTERREYDFGAGAPGPLKRRTDFTYLHTGNQNYLSW